MDTSYWHKQTSDKALFPNLLWSRPENRQFAGKLLIIGGNQYGFAAAGEAFIATERAGIGVTRVLLPDALKKMLGHTLEVGEFAASTPSGSFSKKALIEFMIHSDWADGVLLAGDLGRNSETAILIEKFITSYHGPLFFTKDAADYVTSSPHAILHRPNTTLVISLAQLQKLALNAHFDQPFTFGMDFLTLIATLHTFTLKYQLNIIVKHLDNIFVSVQGEVSSTQLRNVMEIWRVQTAAYAAVWFIQGPTQPFQSLTTAVYEVSQQKQKTYVR